MSQKPLPACILPDAKPFSNAGTQALIVDEVGNIVDEAKGRLDSVVWSARALRAMTWWVGLEHVERQTLTRWLNSDIQETTLARRGRTIWH
jgi:hypothetical protein